MIPVISEIFDGIDLSIEDRFDARPRQLRRRARANLDQVMQIIEN
jgi:hypothetical protein